MADRTPLVLDVGQCDLDHGTIAAMLRREFGAEVNRAHGAEDALGALAKRPYDLVLVNRIFDRDGAEGLGLVRRIKSDEASARVTIMLVSNYEDAQTAAVAAGAVRGFGKAAVESPETLRLLAAYLHA